MKSLKNYTLQELAEYCEKEHHYNCTQYCPFRNLCNTSDLMNPPHAWDLTTAKPLILNETITWHRYPDEKPPLDLKCVLTIAKNGGLSVTYFTDSGSLGLDTPDELRVVAWAKMPKGFEEVEE